MTLTLAGVLGISGWCAWRVLDAAEAVMEAANDKETYVLFLTDEGAKSDNAAVADRLNESQAALVAAKGEAVMLLVVCALLAGALAWRVIKANRPSR